MKRTLLKRIQGKGFIANKTLGNSFQYHSLLNKENYVSKQMRRINKRIFGEFCFTVCYFFTNQINLINCNWKSGKKLSILKLKGRTNNNLSDKSAL
ncbi:BlaI/MecI/CopY family transcriptional regulator [Arachidicoccus sp.]|uniref:BlaI/MecI/CopY family transcriptional regulator n=1 Tax=Arachidicoccus sp. TaxID=1872624 RepID=UPI003D1F2702